MSTPSRDSSSAHEPVRVLIADDHPVFRSGLQALLAAHTGVSVVGEAADGAAAVTTALNLQPDVVIMDLHMPALDGIDATRKIIQHSPHIGVLVLTMSDDDASVFNAIRAGARAGVPQLWCGARRVVGGLTCGNAEITPFGVCA